MRLLILGQIMGRKPEVCFMAGGDPISSSKMTDGCRSPVRVRFWIGPWIPTPGDLPDRGIEPASLTSRALAGGFFTTASSGNSMDRSSWQVTVHRVAKSRTQLSD